jgi:hypothetical protein
MQTGPFSFGSMDSASFYMEEGEVFDRNLVQNYLPSAIAWQ